MIRGTLNVAANADKIEGEICWSPLSNEAQANINYAQVTAL